MKCILRLLKSLLCHTDSPEPSQLVTPRLGSSQRNRSSELDPRRENLNPLNTRPRILNNSARTSRESPQSMIAAGNGHPSTPSLLYVDINLQSKPSPESPDATEDRVVRLVLRLQRRVIKYVEELGLQSDQCSLTRYHIYSHVLGLTESTVRNPDEYKDVAKSLQVELTKPISPLSRASTDLIKICKVGREISSAMREDSGNYAFANFGCEQPVQGRRTEFPGLKKDETPLLEAVEYEERSDEAP